MPHVRSVDSRGRVPREFAANSPGVVRRESLQRCLRFKHRWGRRHAVVGAPQVREPSVLCIQEGLRVRDYLASTVETRGGRPRREASNRSVSLLCPLLDTVEQP